MLCTESLLNNAELKMQKEEVHSTTVLSSLEKMTCHIETGHLPTKLKQGYCIIPFQLPYFLPYTSHRNISHIIPNMSNEV